MKRRIAVALLVAFLSATISNAAWKVPHVLAPLGGNVWIVPSGPSPTLAAAVAGAGPNDEIHIQVDYWEVLGADLIITQANLWIIGSRLDSGAPPFIDLGGFTIVIAAPNVFMWGLSIWDSGGTSNGIVLTAPSSSCTIMNNIIRGPYPVLNPSCTGILVLTSGNTIALNVMGGWNTCIDLASPSSIGNIVKANVLFPSGGGYLYGISVSLGAGFNYVYWNNLITFSSTELYDGNPPGSLPNWFDDTTGGGPSRNKGNFEATWASPLPYLVPPGTNGYQDNWPLVAGINMLAGDLNLDGQVSLSDLVILAQNYGKVWCQLGWDPRADIATSYGAISLSDLVVLAQNYDKKL